jgi:hypothetical protein
VQYWASLKKIQMAVCEQAHSLPTSGEFALRVSFDGPEFDLKGNVSGGFVATELLALTYHMGLMMIQTFIKQVHAARRSHAVQREGDIVQVVHVVKDGEHRHVLLILCRAGRRSMEQVTINI